VVDTVERRLDDADTFRLRSAASTHLLWAHGDVDQRRHPVEGGEQLVITVPGLDDPGQRITIGGGSRFPGLAFLALERRDATVGKLIASAPLSVVKTTIVLSSGPCPPASSTVADVVVHLFHPAS